MAEPYERNIAPGMDEKEYCQHIRAIDKLVHELGVPAEVVHQSYQMPGRSRTGTTFSM